ncbi:MAG: hypothetical protein Q8N42_01955 [bacterium]|nr:hypothetical protein [bacterium]
MKAAPLAGKPTTETTGQAEGQAPGEPRIVGLHTLKGDISSYMKEKDMSLIDVAAEISKHRRFNEETTQTKKTLLLAAGIFLLVAGLGIGTWLILKESQPGQTGSALKTPKSLVFSNKQKIIILKSESRSELIGLIQQSLDSPIDLNTILDLPISLKIPKDEPTGQAKEKKEFLAAQRFLEILGITPPANMTQSLAGPFTLGIFYLKKNSPFLIFQIRSFDLGKSGALSWEKNMARDLREIMLINLPQENQQFQDKLIKNRDSRVLYDNAGNPALIYAFFGKNYLVITSDSDTFEEIIRRFNISPPAS